MDNNTTASLNALMVRLRELDRERRKLKKQIAQLVKVYQEQAPSPVSVPGGSGLAIHFKAMVKQA